MKDDPPAQQEAEITRDENQLVTFFLGNEEYGFDIMSVQEIIRPPQLCKVPMTASYIDGIANLRGMVLPILDTRSRFGLPRVEDTDRTRILVIDVKGNKTGMRVDRVRQVTRIQPSNIEAPPAVIRDGMNSDFLQGVVKLDQGKRIIMSLNPQAVCKLSLETEKSIHPVKGNKTAAEAVGKRGTGEDQSIVQLVSFKLGEEEFSFRMEQVREILRVDIPNEVPDSPKHVLGVLTVRGNILPVVDLRQLLGLSALSDELAAGLLETARKYEVWLEGVRKLAESTSNQKYTADSPEQLKKWMQTFNTSSQVLIDGSSKIRAVNDRVLKGLGASGQPLSVELIKRDVLTPGRETLELLRTFAGLVKDNIREDQRLVVVQAQGTLLALLVDKVREVLNVPKRLIDGPPHLAKAHNTELAGIAKLDDGKRVIVMLEANNILPEEHLEDLKKLGHTSNEAATMDDHKQTSGQATQARDEQQFVTFILGNGEYGIPIANIQEIDRSSKMTRIPRSAPYVDGVTNLRGEIVPVISARKRFSLPQKDSDERTRVIIMDIGGKKTGLLVDSVREVLSLSRKDIAPPPQSINGQGKIDRQYISGIGKLNNGKRMIVLLDVQKIVVE